MTKFETIWKQLSALVLSGIKFLLKNFICYQTQFIGHTIEKWGEDHAGEAVLNLAEEAGSFICEILKEFRQ